METRNTPPRCHVTANLTWLLPLVLVAGCQSLTANRDGLGSGTPPVDAENVSVPSEDSGWLKSTQHSANQVVNFISGRELENLPRAKDLYQQGDAAFRQAKSRPQGERARDFANAAKLFRKAGEAAPGTALQQDALFMQGESLFFADQLTDATDVYEKLQKDFPRSRHNDRVAARLFSISRYWIETVKANEDSWLPVNLTDSKRPFFDVDGHAIRVLDQIRYDDPTGRLADDATMAAAAEYIRQKKFEQADEFLTDLRETFGDSDHLFLAHLLGIRTKLEVYAGPRYSGLVLDEAEKLVQQTRQRFPDKLQDPKYADMVARAAAEITYLHAERLAYRADYREKRHEYGAARKEYERLLQEHPQTPQADLARKRLAAIEGFPAVPEQRLSWLTNIFRDTRRSSPLVPTEAGSILR